MSLTFEEQADKIAQKIWMNPNLVKTIQCRDPYECCIVYSLAEKYGLEHKKIKINGRQKKRIRSIYDKNFCDRRYIEEYYCSIYGVRLSATKKISI